MPMRSPREAPMAETTPRPWSVRVHENDVAPHVVDASGNTVAIVLPFEDDDEPSRLEAVADAELLVRAVNAHEKLLGALYAVLVEVRRLPMLHISLPLGAACDQARAVITGLEGK